MDGRAISKKLQALGFKPEKSHATAIRGYRKYIAGDYNIYTEKSFGLFGLSKRDRIRNIECSEQVLPIVEKMLAENNVPILDKWHNRIIVKA